MSGGTRGKPWSPGCVGNVFLFLAFRSVLLGRASVEQKGLLWWRQGRA